MRFPTSAGVIPVELADRVLHIQRNRRDADARPDRHGEGRLLTTMPIIHVIVSAA
jgi:hypothetical protein